jgi:hypothetical protein
MVIWPELPPWLRLAADSLSSPTGSSRVGIVSVPAGFPAGRVRNNSEILPATGLIVARPHGFKGAAGKIIIRNGAAAGRTGVGHVDERIAASVAAVRIGAGLKEQGRQHEEHHSFYHVIFLPG